MTPACIHDLHCSGSTPAWSAPTTIPGCWTPPGTDSASRGELLQTPAVNILAKGYKFLLESRQYVVIAVLGDFGVNVYTRVKWFSTFWHALQSFYIQKITVECGLIINIYFFLFCKYLRFTLKTIHQKIKLWIQFLHKYLFSGLQMSKICFDLVRAKLSKNWVSLQF